MNVGDVIPPGHVGMWGYGETRPPALPASWALGGRRRNILTVRTGLHMDGAPAAAPHLRLSWECPLGSRHGSKAALPVLHR